MVNESIGKNIVSLREKNNLTRKQLSELLKINYSTLANYENGVREPDAETLIHFAKYFSVSVDELLGLAPIMENEGEDKTLERLLSVARRSDKKTVELAIEIFNRINNKIE